MCVHVIKLCILTICMQKNLILIAINIFVYKYFITSAAF